MVSRLGRDSTLASLVLVLGNLLTIAIAVYGIVKPLSLNVNVFVVAFSVLGLVASAHEWGARPERRRERVYDGAKEMAKLLYDLEAIVDKREAATPEMVESVRASYRHLVGEVADNHTEADHMLANKEAAGWRRPFWLIRGNFWTLVYGLCIGLLLGTGGWYFVHQSVDNASPGAEHVNTDVKK